MSTRLHLSMRVSDIEASTRFYTALFGAAPDKVRADYARFQPVDVPVTLALMPGVGEVGRGRIDHLGIKLDVDPAQVWDRLQGAGLVGAPEENVTCCYAVQDKAWFTDPDGHAWEVYQVTDEAPESETLRGDSSWKASGCCGGAVDDTPKSACCG